MKLGFAPPVVLALALCLGVAPAHAQGARDSDRDGLPDHLDSSPVVVYKPGFDWRHCPPMDLNPANDTQPECKARERVAQFLVGNPSYVKNIAFCVVKNGKVHFADAFEHVGYRQIKHDPDGIHRLFRIGSTTKSLVVTAAKILEERKKLSLDDWVSDDDGSRVTVGGKRTLRHLLTHQGAFRLDSGHIYLFGYPGTLRAFWQEKDDKVSPHYNSSNYGNLGGGYVYSAFNYSLAGAHLEHRTGLSFEKILQTLVFDAASMSTATVDGTRANKAPIGGTVGVCRTSSMHLGPYINLVSPTDPYCIDNFYSSNDIYGKSSYSQQSYRLDECSGLARDPAGGVMASVVDMAHFAREVLDSYKGRGGLLSQSGIRDLFRPSHDLKCGSNCPYQRYYAVGFFVDTLAGRPVNEVEHGGSRAGYHSVFVIRPEADTAVAILVNANVNLTAMNKVGKAILDDFAKPLTGLVHEYGSGCPGTGRAVPALSVIGVPTLGSAITVQLRRALPKAGAMLLIGDSRSAWGPIALPFDLGLLGAPGCKALAAGHAVVTLRADANGAALLPFQVPNLGALSGDRIFVQALVLDPGANTFGAVVSNGADLRIGG